MGLSSNRFCLNGLAGGNRGGLCTRLSLHKSTLSLGVWLRVSVARVFRAQSESQVSELSSEKSCKNIETHVESNTRFQRQGPADLQPFIHDEEIPTMSYTMSYTTSYAILHTTSYAISYTTSYNYESCSFTLIVLCNDIPGGAGPTTGTGSPLIALSIATLSRTLQSGAVDRKQARGPCCVPLG